MTRKPRFDWPNIYAFGCSEGPIHQWFAWHPVRLWYGRWVWLKHVRRVRIVKYGGLPGPDWSFWSYTDQPTEGREP